ncbi:MAG: hypothetical protein JOZ08_25275 [Verrucomicrobia bacterium]|nr:hypothetical protein [Verrucomicrobiota bacterium]MBV8279976.1 hypothetical protein [Verrucomicrobiota bacterium]
MNASEPSLWAEEVAGRLRMLQTSFADDAPKARQEYLTEEIERSLKEVAGSRRGEFLDALVRCFPGPERVAISGPDAIPASSTANSKSADELAEDLIVRLPELTKERRARLVERFRSVGLVAAPDRCLDLPAGLRGKLGLSLEQTLDEERLAKLLAALLEMVTTLDGLVWSLWRMIAPKSVVQREAGDGLRRTVGRYVAGDREVATPQINQMLDKTRQLFASLLSAIGPTGETYARKHLETFAPEKIRATVETGGFLTNVEQKCWRRYVVLTSELNGPVIEKQIIDSIVNYTEEILSGRKRGGELPSPARPAI